MDAPRHGYGNSSSERSSLAGGEEMLNRQKLTTVVQAKRLSRHRPSPTYSQAVHAQRITCCRACLHSGERPWLSPDLQSYMRRLSSCRSKWSRGSGKRWKQCSPRRDQVRRQEQAPTWNPLVSKQSLAEWAWWLEEAWKVQREAGLSLRPGPEWIWVA